MVSMKEAIVDFFKRYVKFKGRSTRAAFWWIQLAAFLLGLVFGIFISLAGSANWVLSLVMLIIFIVVILAILVPSVALTFRRYQDVGFNINGALILYALYILLIFFSDVNGFFSTLAIIVFIISNLIWLLPSDFLVGKFGKLTRDK